MTVAQLPPLFDSTSAFMSTLREYGVKRAWLFGSFARGEQTRTSDIDLLVEFRDDYDYGILMHLGEDLAEVAGRPVDVLTKIKEPFRRFIEPDLIELKL